MQLRVSTRLAKTDVCCAAATSAYARLRRSVRAAGLHAETVAAPLEQAINGVEHMMYMKSVASSDGTMTLSVTFRPGTNPDDAQVQVQNRVSQHPTTRFGRSPTLGHLATTGRSPLLGHPTIHVGR